MPDSSPFLTPAQLAERWQISRSAVYKIPEGDLPRFRPTKGSKAIRFRIADVEEYEQRSQVVAIEGTRKWEPNEPMTFDVLRKFGFEG